MLTFVVLIHLYIPCIVLYVLCKFRVLLNGLIEGFATNYNFLSLHLVKDAF